MKLTQLVFLTERMRARLGDGYTGHLVVCIRPDDYVEAMRERYPKAKKESREHMLTCDLYVLGTRVIHHPGAPQMEDS